MLSAVLKDQKSSLISPYMSAFALPAILISNTQISVTDTLDATERTIN